MRIYDKVDLERVEISKEVQIFNHMQVNKSINDYIWLEDQILIYNILKSVEWSTDAKKKKKELEQIASKYWLKYLGTGTNRIVLEAEYDNRIVVKIPFKETNLCDGSNELMNQEFLKPGICKTFDVGFMGVASLHEKVTPIKYTEQLEKPEIAKSHFDLINSFQHKGFMFDDVGKRNFRNLGIREGFGVVLLDYPTAYKIPTKKLFCKLCGGRIDYIAGFDRIECRRCGKVYTAQAISEGSLTNYAKGLIQMDYQQKGKSNMAIRLVNKETGKVILETESIKESKTIEKKPQTSRNPFTSKAKLKNVNIKFSEDTMIQKDPVDIKTRKNPGQKVFDTKEVPAPPVYIKTPSGVCFKTDSTDIYSISKFKDEVKKEIKKEESKMKTTDMYNPICNISIPEELENTSTKSDTLIPLPNGNVSAKELEKIVIEIHDVSNEEINYIPEEDNNPEKNKRRNKWNTKNTNKKFKKKFKFNYDIKEEDF